MQRGICMEYPEEFSAKVRELFPDHGDIEQCLQNGSDILGRILDDNHGALFTGPDYPRL